MRPTARIFKNVFIEHGGLFVLLIFAAYLPALGAGLFFDDQEVLFSSQEFFSLWQTFKRFLFVDRPLVNLSYRLDFKWSGFSPWGFHLSSVVIHLAATYAVFQLARLIFETWYPASKTRFLAFALALVFAVHPIQTEAVSYVAGRSASLAALFYFLAGWFFLRMRAVFLKTQCWSKRDTLGCLGALVLGYWSKETIFSFPLVVGLLAWLDPKPQRRFYQILLGVLVGLGVVGVALKHRTLAQFLSDGIALDYLRAQLGVFWRYVGLLLFPIHQSLDHEVVLQPSWAAVAVWIPALAYGLLVTGLVAVRKRCPLATLGGFWFLLTLLPESSIIPIPDVMVERRLYLPSFGFFLLLLSPLTLILPRVNRRAFWGVVGVLVALLGGFTFKRNVLYQDAVLMWRDVVIKAPGKVRGYINLGSTHLDRQELTEADAVFRRALALQPRNAIILSNLGTVADRGGKKLEAFHFFQQAEEISPKDPLIIYNLARLLFDAGETAMAQEKFRTIMALNPRLPFGYFGQGLVAETHGQDAMAMGFYQKTLDAHPCFGDALVNLGNLFYRQGNLAKSLQYYDQALTCDPNHAIALLNRAQARFSDKDLAGARRDYSTYLRLNPQAWLPHYKLAIISLLEKNERQGRVWLQQALPLARGQELEETEMLLQKLNTLK